MALYYALPVYRDTYRMILQTFHLTREFPREYKYSLGQDLRRDSMQLVRHIYRANVASGNVRREVLEQFSSDFELVRLQWRLAFDLHLVAVKPFGELTEWMEQIGRQVTGWRRTATP